MKVTALQLLRQLWEDRPNLEGSIDELADEIGRSYNTTKNALDYMVAAEYIRRRKIGRVFIFSKNHEPIVVNG